MKGPPLPLPTLRPPLPSRRGGAGRPAQRVPLVLLCQETGISPPRPTPPRSLRRDPRTLPRLSALPPHPGPCPQPARLRAGARDAAAAPRVGGTHRSARTGPRPSAAARSRSRRCPRRRRPTRSSLGKLRAHVSPGAGRGRQWGGGGGERRGDPRTSGRPGRRDPERESFRGDPASPAGQ